MADKRILDVDGNELTEEEADLELGYLVNDIIITKSYEAEEAVPEQGHLEYETFYFTDGTSYTVTGGDDPHIGPDGWVNLEGEEPKEQFGADQKWVVDVPAKEYMPPRDETENIYRYVLYTEEQLAEKEARETYQAQLLAAIEVAKIVAASLDDEQAAAVPTLYSLWDGAETYSAGDRVRHARKLWKSCDETVGEEPGDSGVWECLSAE